MNLRTSTPALQRAALERTVGVLEGDPRYLAAWLEGSFAAGTEDAWSDLDVHVAVRDEDYDRCVAEAPALIASIGAVIGLNRARLPQSDIFIACIDGPVRLDLFLEPASAAGDIPRPAPPRMLFDRGEIASQLRVDEEETRRLVRARVRGLVDEYFAGFVWPARLMGRGEHGSLLANAVLVLYATIVPAILARVRPAEALRTVLHNERLLPPEERARVDSMVAELQAAFAGVGTGTLDERAVGAAHERLIELALESLRGASVATGLEWPVESERKVREFYRDEAGLNL